MFFPLLASPLVLSPLAPSLLRFNGVRVLTELVSKMRDMQMDKTELGCLRAIILFNPGESGKRLILSERIHCVVAKQLYRKKDKSKQKIVLVLKYQAVLFCSCYSMHTSTPT